jgi:hypothetical protein
MTSIRPKFLWFRLSAGAPRSADGANAFKSRTLVSIAPAYILHYLMAGTANGEANLRRTAHPCGQFPGLSAAPRITSRILIHIQEESCVLTFI